MTLPNMDTIRRAVYPEEWQQLIDIGRTDKAEARAIVELFWAGFERDPRKDYRMAVTAEAWRQFDGD